MFDISSLISSFCLFFFSFESVLLLYMWYLPWVKTPYCLNTFSALWLSVRIKILYLRRKIMLCLWVINKYRAALRKRLQWNFKICLLGERKMLFNYLIIKMQSFQTENSSFMPIYCSKSITNFKNLQNAYFEGKYSIFKWHTLTT